MLARQRRAQESFGGKEKRIADAARKANVRASESYEAAERRRIEDAKRKAACRAAMSEEEKAQRRLENAKRMAAFRASLPEEEKKRRRAENAERVALMRASKAAKRSEQMQFENMAAINQAWNENGIISFPFYPVFNYESNSPIQVHFAQNQPLYQQNGWGALMPNAIPAVLPSYTVQENSIMPNNIETPPPEILETSTVVKSPQDVFVDDKSYHLKKRGRKPGTKKPVPVKKMCLWEWAEKSKNVKGSRPNNLGSQAQQQNAAKTNNLSQAQQLNAAKTVKIEMNSLNYFNKQFEQMQKSKNGCKNLLQTITPGIQTEQDEPAQIKMEYFFDSSIPNENVEKFNNGCEEQTDSSTVGVHLVKTETVSIEMEHSTNSSEQLENIGDQLSSSTTAICLEKDETVLTTMEHLMDSSEEMGKVETLNGHESQPEILSEKDENFQIKMEFAVDSSEQIENVEPWNMFTLEFLTPSVNIETQNDVAAPISVSDSVDNTRNPSDTSDNVPASCPLICPNIAVNAVNNNGANFARHQEFLPISLKTDTQSLVQEIEVLKAKDALYTVENKTLMKKIKKLEKAYKDSIKTQESMQEQIQEFIKNNSSMSKMILEIEKHNKALNEKLVELLNENCVLSSKICNLEKQNEDLTSKLKFPSIKIEPL